MARSSNFSRLWCIEAVFSSLVPSPVLFWQVDGGLEYVSLMKQVVGCVGSGWIGSHMLSLCRMQSHLQQGGLGLE